MNTHYTARIKNAYRVCEYLREYPLYREAVLELSLLYDYVTHTVIPIIPACSQVLITKV